MRGRMLRPEVDSIMPDLSLFGFFPVVGGDVDFLGVFVGVDRVAEILVCLDEAGYCWVFGWGGLVPGLGVAVGG